MADKILDERFRSILMVNAPTIVIFWGTLAASQRLLGSINIYASRRWTFPIGVGMVTVCSMMTHEIHSFLLKYQFYYQIPLKEQEYRVGITTIIFSLLERNAFQTVFPSSVITIGGYAKGSYLPWIRGSVPSTSPTATSSQRAEVNRIGRLHGCHHCGSRQIVGWKPFIADHMPPTKFANEMNQIFWRRWFGLTVKQSLYPQCQSCFQLQGNAVRINYHELIYQFRPRLVHLSPLIAILIAENKECRKYLDEFFDGVWEELQRWATYLKNLMSDR